MDSLSTIPFAIPTGAEPVRLEIPAEVRKALSSLALAVNHGLEEEQLKVTAYALRDVPVPYVRRACLELAGRAQFWPKPVEIRECAAELEREDARQASAAKVLPWPKEDDEGPRYFCLTCRDEPASWAIYWCPGVGTQRADEKPERLARTLTQPCARRGDHGQHTFAEKCACADTNPVAAEHRRRMDEARQARDERKARRR